MKPRFTSICIMQALFSLACIVSNVVALVGPDPHPSWVAGAWEDCQILIKGDVEGRTWRLVTCKDHFSAEDVDDSLCSKVKPKEYMQCFCASSDESSAIASGTVQCKTGLTASIDPENVEPWPSRTQSHPPFADMFHNIGCIPDSLAAGFPRGNSEDFLDESCKFNAKKTTCYGNFPFFNADIEKLPSHRPRLDRPDCPSFCLAMGLDGFVITVVDSSPQCHCGATKVNAAVWQHKPHSPQLEVDLSKISHCDSSATVKVFIYTGHYEDEAMPTQWVTAHVQHEQYMCRITGRDCEDVSDNPAGDDVESDLSQSRGLQAGGVTGYARKCWPYPNQCAPIGPKSTINQRMQLTPPLGVPDKFNKYVMVRYVFNSNMDSGRKTVFREAADRWRKATCINLVEQGNLNDANTYDIEVRATTQYTCSAMLGMRHFHHNGPLGRINLGWCREMTHVGNMVHEIGHSLGMNHEQKRPDAAQTYMGKGPFLNLKWQNIPSSWIPQWRPDFDSYVGSADDGNNDAQIGYAPYDFESIMHYPVDYDDGSTIPASARSKTGNRRYLSQGDILQVMDMYNCNSDPDFVWNTTTTTTVSTTIDALQFVREINCNFEKDMCLWVETSSQRAWNRRSGPTPTANTGPSVDNTLGTSSGFYAYVSSVYGAGHSYTLATSPFYLRQSGILTFWYHMFGSEMGTLELQAKDPSGPWVTVWSKAGQQQTSSSAGWQQSTVSIPQHVGQLQFKGTTLSGTYTRLGDMAIDDVNFAYSPDPVANLTWTTTTRNGLGLDCTFETDSCYWSETSCTTGCGWKRDSGTTPSYGTGPAVDHTYGTAYGYYMFVEASSPNYPYKTFALGSVTFSLHQSGFLGFWYHMYGDYMGTLKLDVKTSSTAVWTTLWQKTGQQQNAQSSPWLHAVVQIPQGAIQLQFNGITGSNFASDMAIDDVTFSYGSIAIMNTSTTVTTTFSRGPVGPLDCDFGMVGTWQAQKCVWSETTNTSMIGHHVGSAWMIRAGQTPSASTGPSVDSTYGTSIGRYLYLEASGSNYPSKTFAYTSPNFNLQQSAHLKFWYHMYGSGMGTLRLQVRLGSSSSWSTQWTMSGQQQTTSSASWVQATVAIPQTATHIQFVGITGNSYTSDMAIDDISFVHPGNNMGNLVVVTTTTTTTTRSLGQFSSIDCAFETGQCSWHDNGGNAWKRNSGSTPSSGTGPSADHTFGTYIGSYMYVESSSPNYGGKVFPLECNSFSLSHSGHLIFWYHMYGSDMGKLEVQVRTAQGGPWTTAWSKTGQQQESSSDDWAEAVVPISQSVLQLQFLATTGNDFQSDMAIDDITFTLGGAVRNTTTATTTTVPVGPVDCTFESSSSSCLWSGTTSYAWTRRQGSTPSYGTGPSVDNTLGTRYGYYTYLEASTPNYPSKTFTFGSPTFSLQQSAHLTFYYHMYGSSMGTLEFQVKEGSQASWTTLWSKIGQQQSSMSAAWIQARVPIPQAVTLMQFTGTTSYSYEGDMAIDDIRFEHPGNNLGNLVLVATTTTTSTTSTTTRTVGPGGMDCDFEIDSCSWSSSSYAWRRNYGSTASSATGPTVDHTTGSYYGYYMYVEASSPNYPQKVFTLESPATQLQQSGYLSFWYHMYGAHIGKFEVQVRIGTQTQWTTPWALSGQQQAWQSDAWRQAFVQVPQDAVNVRFRYTTGLSYEGDAAIDDISFAYGSIPSTSSQTTTYYQPWWYSTTYYQPSWYTTSKHPWWYSTTTGWQGLGYTLPSTTTSAGPASTTTTTRKTTTTTTLTTTQVMTYAGTIQFDVATASQANDLKNHPGSKAQLANAIADSLAGVLAADVKVNSINIVTVRRLLRQRMLQYSVSRLAVDYEIKATNAQSALRNASSRQTAIQTLRSTLKTAIQTRLQNALGMTVQIMQVQAITMNVVTTTTTTAKAGSSASSSSNDDQDFMVIACIIGGGVFLSIALCAGVFTALRASGTCVKAVNSNAPVANPSQAAQNSTSQGSPPVKEENATSAATEGNNVENLPPGVPESGDIENNEVDNLPTNDVLPEDSEVLRSCGAEDNDVELLPAPSSAPPPELAPPPEHADEI